MTRIPAILVVLAACGNGGPKHWKDQPLVEITGTAGGHAYSLQAPQGTEASKVDPNDWSYKYEAGGEKYVTAPSFSISWREHKQTLDDALKDEKEPPLHKEASADGWMFSQENPYEKGKDRYVVEVERYVGDGALFCQGQVWPMSRSKDDVKNQLLPLVEKMCASLKAK
ncbi:MAG TPA: hypothetical protein VLT45_25405 [Kofleriaceae bacterium]|nr:hypothetical protein [Kofleriaceae bacterium]